MAESVDLMAALARSRETVEEVKAQASEPAPYTPHEYVPVKFKRRRKPKSQARKNMEAVTGTAPKPRGDWGQYLAGVMATWDGDCLRCPDPVLRQQRVVKHGNGWIHIQCASGQNDV